MKKIKWTVFVFVIMHIKHYYAENADSMEIQKLAADIIERINEKGLHRRNFRYPSRTPILGVPRYPEHLPAAEPILPGHTLLKPSRGMLKSSVKFPLRDFGGATVYGNLDNVGITWGRTRDRIRYSDFRKANNLLSVIQNAVQSSKSNSKEISHPVIVIEIDPSELKMTRGAVLQDQVLDGENNANEILDDLDALLEENSNESFDLRRKSKHRDRGKLYDRSDRKSSTSSSSSDSSSDLEKNPGNPFTIHKSKYKQNWMWDHEMTGDHMNINPFAPQLNALGPTGAELFFGRKWWYFNQDDYKPM